MGKSSLNKKIILVLLFLFLVSVVYASATPLPSPSFTIYCNVNTEFLENNICTSDNCTLVIWKFGDYYEISSSSTKGEFMYIFKAQIFEKRMVHILNTITMNETSIDYIQKVCKEDISPIRKYLELNGDCIASQNKSEITWGKRTSLSGGWHMGCSTDKNERQSIFLMLMIVGFLVAVFVMFFLIKKRKK